MKNNKGIRRRINGLTVFILRMLLTTPFKATNWIEMGAVVCTDRMDGSLIFLGFQNFSSGLIPLQYNVELPRQA